MRILLVLPLLVGCSPADQESLQQALDTYAAQATQPSSLPRVLTGEALANAQKSAELLAELGITQTGQAHFAVNAASEGLGRGCLDLSKVRLFSAKGELLIPARANRVEFEASYQSDFRISKLEISERAC